MIKNTALVLSFLAFILTTGCAKPPLPEDLPRPSQQQIIALSDKIMAMGDDVDPAEAKRAAQIAYNYPLKLAQEYEITDHPLIHNTKINAGKRTRGLCWQWADDMGSRLRRENFKTLVVHRAIANYKNPIIIEHSTMIIAQRGDGQDDGIVLDPWRHGGLLFWAPTLQDKKYRWIPRDIVFAQKRADAKRRAARAAKVANEASN